MAGKIHSTEILNAYEVIMAEGQVSSNGKVLNGVEAFEQTKDTLAHLRGEGVELTLRSTHRIHIEYNQAEHRDKFLEKLAMLAK
ncbi:DUF3081 family protein [Vibrio sp. 10N.261.55.A7]|uniref:DUF3081 family protein n=1 Tax=Vibrio TaxID=662 RepID=UPI000C86651D|nr:DUF3081 family protein [Vibrio sp. 10N.261.55.A7]PMK02440.1 hypothetical protein BCU12_18425 [Vibrio sp. 10N.261.55.A7]